MIYERIQLTYDNYYLQRVLTNKPYSEKEIIQLLNNILDVNLYLFEKGNCSSTFHMKDFVITKNNEVKIFLIPKIKITKSNKIVVRELKNLIEKVKSSEKKKNLTVRLKKA